MAVIVQIAYRPIRKTLNKDLVLWLLFGGVAVATVWTGREMVLLFILSGLIAMSWKSRGRRPSLPLLQPHAPLAVRRSPRDNGCWFLGKLGFFFLKAGAFVFGSGLAIVPFLYGGVVNQFHWLSEHQFLDAIAVAMITPGPVVITAAFVGYLVAGLPGGTTAAVAVFAPPFLIVIGAAPYYRKFAPESSKYVLRSGCNGSGCGRDRRCSGYSWEAGYLRRSVRSNRGWSIPGLLENQEDS